MKQAPKDDAGERAFTQTYTYTRTRITENRDPKGKLQSREEKRDVRKPAATPPAAPQPAPTSRPATAGMKGSEALMTRSSPAPRGRAFDRSDFILNGDLLNRFTFKTVGREIINGRSSLVLDFQPAKRQPSPKSIQDRFINKAAGQLWIDEEESILARAKLRLTEGVSVGAGLIASIAVFDYEFDRNRTEEGFWFTRTTKWHLEGREVILRKNVDYHEEKSELRKATTAN